MRTNGRFFGRKERIEAAARRGSHPPSAQAPFLRSIQTAEPPSSSPFLPQKGSLPLSKRLLPQSGALPTGGLQLPFAGLVGHGGWTSKAEKTALLSARPAPFAASPQRQKIARTGKPRKLSRPKLANFGAVSGEGELVPISLPTRPGPSSHPSSPQRVPARARRAHRLRAHQQLRVRVWPASSEPRAGQAGKRRKAAPAGCLAPPPRGRRLCGPYKGGRGASAGQSRADPSSLSASSPQLPAQFLARAFTPSPLLRSFQCAWRR